MRRSDREFGRDHEGPLCILPRYERLVEVILGTDALAGVEFTYPDGGEEVAAIARSDLGVYLRETGTTAREYGLTVGEQLFPSETVLLENEHEVAALDDRRHGAERASRLARVKELFAATDPELAVQWRGVRLHENGDAPERRGRRAAREACRRR